MTTAPTKKKSTKPRTSVKRDGSSLELKGFAGFETMPEAAGDLSTVTCVKLVKCSFAELPSCLAEMPFDRLFVVECPEVTALPRWVSDKMVMVWIEKCPLRTVPPPSLKLESLNLWSTLIEALPDLAKNPNLSSIHITDAPLTQLPDDLGELQLLEEVHVSKCPHLTELPDSICRLAKLKTLEVYDTGLAAVPDRIGDLKALQRLVLGSHGGNRLTAVPDSVCDIEKLHLLWLGNNQLESLPARIGALTSLQYLSVDHNKLTSLPDSVFELHPFTLEDEFDFHDNPIPTKLVASYKAKIKEICRADRAARKAARIAAGQGA